MDTKYLNVAEAAAYLCATERFIRRLIFERRIRFYKAGKYVRLAVADLDDFMESGRVEPVTRTSAVTSLRV